MTILQHSKLQSSPSKLVHRKKQTVTIDFHSSFHHSSAGNCTSCITAKLNSYTGFLFQLQVDMAQSLTTEDIVNCSRQSDFYWRLASLDWLIHLLSGGLAFKGLIMCGKIGERLVSPDCATKQIPSKWRRSNAVSLYCLEDSVATSVYQQEFAPSILLPRHDGKANASRIQISCLTLCSLSHWAWV